MLITDNQTNKNMLTAQFNKLTKNQKGFTLIELLVVIGILAILLAIVLIAINPAKQFAQADNTKRRSDVSAILNAIGAYAADKKGDISALGLTSTAADAGKNAICTALVPTYISLLPTDPTVSGGSGIACGAASADVTTGYTVTVDANGRVTVSAPDTQTTYGDTLITATR